MARGGQIIDASIVLVPTQRNRTPSCRLGAHQRGGSRSPPKCGRRTAMRAGPKKHGRSFFGYKNHVNADAKHKLIRHYAVTDAAVHDSQELEGLLDRATPAMMCSPTALIGRPRSRPNSGPVVTTVGFIDAVGATIRQRKCASEPHQEPDTRIEHVFGAQQNAPGGRIVRTIGIVRARAKIGLQNWPTTFAAW